MSHPSVNTTPGSIPLSDDEEEVYIWRDRFPIASMLSDPVRWNSDWENALRKLPASDVYKRMGPFWKARLETQGELVRPALKTMLRELQSSVLQVWTAEWEAGPWQRFQTAWLLLKEEEQLQHLLNALVKVSKSGAIGQDARALCPEITSSLMVQTKGRALLDFLGDYLSQIKAAGQESPFFSPSAWWAKASPSANNSDFDDGDIRAYEILTLQREQFICGWSTRM